MFSASFGESEHLIIIIYMLKAGHLFMIQMTGFNYSVIYQFCSLKNLIFENRR